MSEETPPQNKRHRPNFSRALLIAALVFFLLLFLREMGVLVNSGRLF